MKTILTTLIATLILLPAMAQPINFKLAHSEENKDLKLWEYLPDGQKIEGWTQMFTVHKYKPPITAEEMAKRLAAYNANQKSLLLYDKPSNAVCFVVQSGNVIEANAWRYAEHEGATWGNAVQYRYPADSKAGLKDEIGPGSPFAKACEGMKTWTMKYPQ